MKGGMTAQQIADKQVKRSQAATADYKNGIMATTVSPMASAAKAVDQWFQGVQKAYNDGTYVDALNSTPISVWQNAAVTKGAAAYAPGVAAAAQTIADFHQQRMQAQAGIDSQLSQMPRGDLQTNIQRMVAQVTGMSQFKFKKRRTA
jgi:type IV secretory pathway VirB2 component (pilin)